MNIRLSLAGDQSLGVIGPGLWNRLEDFSMTHEELWVEFLAGRQPQEVVEDWTRNGASAEELRRLSALLKQAAFAADAVSTVDVSPPPTDSYEEPDESPSAFAILASAIDLACGLIPSGQLIKIEDVNATS